MKVKTIQTSIMFKTFITLITYVTLTTLRAQAQGGVVISNNSDDTAHRSAVLDIKSTNQGVLIPRMTVEQRIAIEPDTGLVVYQTDDVAGFYYYDGNRWKILAQGFIQNGHFLVTADTIDSVGIGTLTPQAKLHIKSDSVNLFLESNEVSKSQMRLKINNSESFYSISTTGSALYFYYYDGTIYKKRMYIDPAGRFYIYGSDLILGLDDGRDIGSHTGQRALVHNDNDKLYINYLNDFEGGTVIYGTKTAVVGKLAIGNSDAIEPEHQLDVEGDIFTKNKVLTPSAGYAEYFEAEEPVKPGDLVGINPVTGLARKYQAGDYFVGIAVDSAAYIGNYNEQKVKKGNFVLVGLKGQFPIDKTQVKAKGKLLETKDGQPVGVLLKSGNVFLR